MHWLAIWLEECCTQLSTIHCQAVYKFVCRVLPVKLPYFFASLTWLDASKIEYVYKLEIKAGETGRSYSSVFGTYLDDSVEWVEIEDPYLGQKKPHQLHNLVRFCEMLVKQCKELKEVNVFTIREDSGITKSVSDSYALQL